MINNIKFGKMKMTPKNKNWFFYVHHNLSGNALIHGKHDLVSFSMIISVLSHETLHKVLFKIEGPKISSALDKFCRSRKWLFNDCTGMCFHALIDKEFIVD